MASPAIFVWQTERRPKLLNTFSRAGSDILATTFSTWKNSRAICETVMFRLSSGVTTATASQDSIPALCRTFMSIGTPVTVRPLNASLSCKKFSGSESITATSSPFWSSISASLLPSRPQPTTSTFTLISPVLSFGIRGAPGRRSSGMPVGWFAAGVRFLRICREIEAASTERRPWPGILAFIFGVLS